MQSLDGESLQSRALTHRFTYVVTVVLLTALCGFVRAQAPPDPNYVRQPVFDSYQAFKDELAAISGTADGTARAMRLNTLWNMLRTAGQVPYAQDNRYALLYRGSASSVAFPGDHNNWQPSAGPATQLAGTDLWIREGTLATDARVDYKVVLNASTWILDPVNSLQMWSGFGPNSELRMPQYEYPVETIRRPDAARGSLSANVRTTSTRLGYQVQYRVYTPAGYEASALDDLPVVYVTDGHEYSADHMGSLVAVLDNLIDDGALRPTMAVFVDPRDPNNLGNNRRISQYNMNPNFAGFVTDELVPKIDMDYRTAANADDRVILGTSMGGLASAYFGATESDAFHKIGIQSPAFGFNSSIYPLYDRAPQTPLEIYMTAGTINDGSGGRTMDAILARHGYDYTFVEANEGHSWGNWRGQLADMLLALIGPPTDKVGDYNGDGAVDAADYTVWRDNLGSATALANETATPGMVTMEDYEVWKLNFAAAAIGSGLSLALVPEPSTAALIFIGCTMTMCVSGRNKGITPY